MIFLAGFLTGALFACLAWSIWIGTINWQESKKWARLGTRPHTLDVHVIDGDDNPIDPILKKRKNQV
jgi:hypothetical protein